MSEILSPDKSATPAAVASPNAIVPAMVLRKILTPIDFSDASKKALKYAQAFAQQFHASLHLLNVVEFAMVGAEFGAVELSRLAEDMRENAQKQLAQWMKQEVAATVPADAMVRAGRPYAEIIETAQELEIDLIIIASHGHSSLAHVLLGSTVERVVRSSPCPVLVVRPQGHGFV